MIGSVQEDLVTGSRRPSSDRTSGPVRRLVLPLAFAVAAASLVAISAWQMGRLPRSDRMRRPLIEAVARSDVAVLRGLLDAGADPNAREYPPARPHGPLPLLLSLVDPRARAGLGETILMDAVRRGRADCAALLLSRGADPRASVPGYQDWDALFCAARAGSIECARLLLDAGIPVDEHDATGVTPLMRAASMDRPEMVRYLLDRRADVNARARNGATPLMAAVGDGSLGDKTECVRALLARGAEVNAADRRGETALTIAVRRRCPARIRVLIAHGADPDARHGAQPSPYELAARTRDVSCLAALRSAARVTRSRSRLSP